MVAVMSVLAAAIGADRLAPLVGRPGQTGRAAVVPIAGAVFMENAGGGIPSATSGSGRRPIASVPVLVRGVTVSGRPLQRRLRADRHGRFRLNLPPGTYTFTAILDRASPSIANQPNTIIAVRVGEAEAAPACLDHRQRKRDDDRLSIVGGVTDHPRLLWNVRLIAGDGSPPRERMAVTLAGGRIERIDAAGGESAPAGRDRRRRSHTSAGPDRRARPPLERHRPQPGLRPAAVPQGRGSSSARARLLHPGPRGSRAARRPGSPPSATWAATTTRAWPCAARSSWACWTGRACSRAGASSRPRRRAARSSAPCTARPTAPTRCARPSASRSAPAPASSR